MHLLVGTPKIRHIMRV